MVYESFGIKKDAQLPIKISVHPANFDLFTSMPCLLPPIINWDGVKYEQYFDIKEVHHIEGNVPSLGSDMMLYNAKNGELLALIDCDLTTTMRTGTVAAVSAKLLSLK